MASIWRKLAPKSVQGGPSWWQDFPKGAQDGANMAQDCTKMGPHGGSGIFLGGQNRLKIEVEKTIDFLMDFGLLIRTPNHINNSSVFAIQKAKPSCSS